MTYREKLIKLRIEKKYFQKDFARKCEIGASSYGFYERGIRKPPKKALSKIIKTFKLPQDYFIDCDYVEENVSRINKEVKKEEPKTYVLHHTPQHHKKIEKIASSIEELVVHFDKQLEDLKNKIIIETTKFEEIKKEHDTKISNLNDMLDSKFDTYVELENLLDAIKTEEKYIEKIQTLGND